MSDNVISRPRPIRAKKRHWCWSCRMSIEPGDDYVRRAVFPNMETNQSNTPVVYRSHVDCGTWP